MSISRRICSSYKTFIDKKNEITRKEAMLVIQPLVKGTGDFGPHIKFFEDGTGLMYVGKNDIQCLDSNSQEIDVSFTPRPGEEPEEEVEAKE